MDTSFEASRPRQRRSARARREQKARAAARVISRLVQASTVLAGHRGCQPGQHLTDLANLLTKPLVTGDQDIAPVPQEGPSDESLFNLSDSIEGIDQTSYPQVSLSEYQAGLVQDLPAPHDPAVDADLPRRTVPLLVQFFEQRCIETRLVPAGMPAPEAHWEGYPYDADEDIPLGAILPPEPPQLFLGPIIRAFLPPAPPEEWRWRQVPPFLRGPLDNFRLHALHD